MAAGAYGYDVNGVQVDSTSSATLIWALILGALQAIAGESGSGPPIVQPTVTHNSFGVAASGTRSIPTGAKGFTVVVLTGTATINGIAGLPVGFSWSDTNTLAAGFDVVCASASTAFVSYGS